MPKYLNQIKALKKINKSIVINNKFLINKEGNIKIYYAPFDYVNSKAKIMIVGITPGLQQMLQSFQVINDGKSLKEVKDLSSFKGSMRTILIKYLDELKVNKKLKLGICGEHGGDPKSIDFCSRTGLDYVSCSPFRVPVARLAAAQAELRK